MWLEKSFSRNDSYRRMTTMAGNRLQVMSFSTVINKSDCMNLRKVSFELCAKHEKSISYMLSSRSGNLFNIGNVRFVMTRLWDEFRRQCCLCSRCSMLAVSAKVKSWANSLMKRLILKCSKTSCEIPRTERMNGKEHFHRHQHFVANGMFNKKTLNNIS